MEGTKEKREMVKKGRDEKPKKKKRREEKVDEQADEKKMDESDGR